MAAPVLRVGLGRGPAGGQGTQPARPGGKLELLLIATLHPSPQWPDERRPRPRGGTQTVTIVPGSLALSLRLRQAGLSQHTRFSG